MTSEVVILNSQGIALAADSAVTIGSQKTYNSAIKLFALSKYAPVGVMVYGRAELLGVPWELIIKEFRKKLGKESYRSLDQYADEFITYISNCQFFDHNEQLSWLNSCTERFYQRIRKELFEEVHEHVKTNGKISLDETKAITKKIISRFHADLKTIEYSNGYNKDSEIEHREKYKAFYKSSINNVFENIPLNSHIVGKLYDIATYLITRCIQNRNDVSGIVIAGYGDSEVFPSVITHEITGVIDNVLHSRMLKDRSFKGDSSCSTAIIPFADDQMIVTFMRGISPIIDTFLYKYLSEIFIALPHFIGECFGIKDPYSNNKFTNGLAKINENLFEALAFQQKSEHVDTVMKMVNALPKDELAAMAESLVNLAAFKRKMSSSIESVGGPIDVAVISKGDGLVWVKRKHYFPRELNHNFFNNYLREQYD